MKTQFVTQNVPTIIGKQKSGVAYQAGTIVRVKKTFWRNGEGWARFDNGDELPDVFLSNKKS